MFGDAVSLTLSLLQENGISRLSAKLNKLASDFVPIPSGNEFSRKAVITCYEGNVNKCLVIIMI